MPVDLIETVVILFPNFEFTRSQVVSQLQPNASFAQRVEKDAFQTLSKGSRGSVDIRGFLYVPDLDPADPCLDLREDYIPNNVTRLANLPPSDFTLIALAPWTTVKCTQAYLASAKANPTRAFLFYLPEDESGLPPPPSSPVWNLEDDELWKRTNPYSVYAVSSKTGSQLMLQLSLYSGNLTSVPNGHAIAAIPGGDPRSYVRLYTYIRVSSSVEGFRMWFSMLIVATILVGMMSIVYAATKLVNRTRRNALQHQIANGEVSLEALGTGRSAATKSQTGQLPSFICAQTLEAGVKKQLDHTTLYCPVEDGPGGTDTRRDNNTSHTPLLISEPSKTRTNVTSSHSSCSICVDDYNRE